MEDYNGPVVGFTDQELALLIGKEVLDLFDAHGLQIVWKPKP